MKGAAYLPARQPAIFALMILTRANIDHTRSTLGDLAWGWIAFGFVYTCSALVWGIIGEFLY